MNDDVLTEQVKRFLVVEEACRRFLHADGAEGTSSALNTLIEKVDALRALQPALPYSPTVGDVVWVAGTVLGVNDDEEGYTVKVRTGNLEVDYVYINPNETPIKLAKGLAPGQ